MAIPKAKFIGFSSADPDRYGLPRNVGIKLNDKDINRACELLKYRWFQKKEWQNEIKGMLANASNMASGKVALLQHRITFALDTFSKPG